MWWRTLGVAVVLLGLGVAGGYAVADRTAAAPVEAGVPEPVPAISPAVPTPTAVLLLPDPDTTPLQPDLPLVTKDLRIGAKGIGLSVGVPDGWVVYREQESSSAWNATVPGNPLNTYKLRIAIVYGDHRSVDVAKLSRKAALESAVDNGAISELEFTAETPDAFEATYVAGDYLRLTAERWVSFDGSTAYADISVTGRSVDREGLADLLTRVTSATTPVPAVTDDASAG